jgi:hypothetical protein
VLKTGTNTSPIKDVCPMKKTNIFFVVSLLFSCGLKADDSALLQKLVDLAEKQEKRAARQEETLQRAMNHMVKVAGVIQMMAGNIILPKWRAEMDSLEEEEKKDALALLQLVAVAVGLPADKIKELVGTPPSSEKGEEKTEGKKGELPSSLDDKAKATLHGTN